MKKYKVIQAPEAKEQIKRYLAYLLFVKGSEQAYEAVKEDYYRTLKRLEEKAGMRPDPDEKELLDRELKKFFFDKHDYVMLYRIKDGDEPVAEVAYIFHTSEDYIHKIH